MKIKNIKMTEETYQITWIILNAVKNIRVGKHKLAEFLKGSKAKDGRLFKKIWMQNSNDLSNFISSKIEVIEGVTRTCPAILMERLKEV